MSWKTKWRAKDPKAPKQVAPGRPYARDLRAIYKNLATTDDGQRLNALAQALHWYDIAIPYVIARHGARTADQAKAWDIAAKCRDRGVSTTFNGEKETAFVTALKRYQKVVSELEPPDLGEYYEELKQNETRLKLRQDKLEERFGNVVDLLNAALKPVNADGKVVEIKVGIVNQSYMMDPARSQLTLHRNMVKELRTMVRVEGLLVVVMELLEPLAKVCIMKPETDSTGQATGRYIAGEKEQRLMEKKLLWNLIEFCKKSDSAPKRLVKSEMARTLTSVSTGQKVQRTLGSGRLTRGPLRAGLFVDKTAAATVFNILLDGQYHTVADLQKLIPAKISNRLHVIDVTGRRLAAKDGMGWQVRVEAGRAKLEFTTPETQPHYSQLWNQQAGA